jgi:hypothetical protein
MPVLKTKNRRVTLNKSFIVSDSAMPTYFVTFLWKRNGAILGFHPDDAWLEVIAADGTRSPGASDDRVLIRPNQGFEVTLIDHPRNIAVLFRRTKSGGLTASVPPEVDIYRC